MQESSTDYIQYYYDNKFQQCKEPYLSKVINVNIIVALISSPFSIEPKISKLKVNFYQLVQDGLKKGIYVSNVASSICQFTKLLNSLPCVLINSFRNCVTFLSLVLSLTLVSVIISVNGEIFS